MTNDLQSNQGELRNHLYHGFQKVPDALFFDQPTDKNEVPVYFRPWGDRRNESGRQVGPHRYHERIDSSRDVLRCISHRATDYSDGITFLQHEPL